MAKAERKSRKEDLSHRANPSKVPQMGWGPGGGGVRVRVWVMVRVRARVRTRVRVKG